MDFDLDINIESMADEVRENLVEYTITALYKAGLHWLRRCTEIMTNRYQNARGGVGIVDTGRLRASLSFVIYNLFGRNPPEGGVSASDYITGQSDKNQLIMGTNVDYASDVELSSSSSKFGARPFVKPSIIEFKDEYKEIIEDTLKGNL